jgi:hypothetical protein
MTRQQSTFPVPATPMMTSTIGDAAFGMILDQPPSAGVGVGVCEGRQTVSVST